MSLYKGSTPVSMPDVSRFRSRVVFMKATTFFSRKRIFHSLIFPDKK